MSTPPSSTCPISLLTDQSFRPEDFENTGLIDFMHYNTHRFGHSNDLLQFIDATNNSTTSQDLRMDYVVGALGPPIVLLSFFLTWAILLLMFKYCCCYCSSIGYLSGKQITFPRPPDAPEHQIRTYYEQEPPLQSEVPPPSSPQDDDNDNHYLHHQHQHPHKQTQQTKHPQSFAQKNRQLVAATPHHQKVAVTAALAATYFNRDYDYDDSYDDDDSDEEEKESEKEFPLDHSSSIGNKVLEQVPVHPSAGENVISFESDDDDDDDTNRDNGAHDEERNEIIEDQGPRGDDFDRDPGVVGEHSYDEDNHKVTDVIGNFVQVDPILHQSRQTHVSSIYGDYDDEEDIEQQVMSEDERSYTHLIFPVPDTRPKDNEEIRSKGSSPRYSKYRDLLSQGVSDRDDYLKDPGETILQPLPNSSDDDEEEEHVRSVGGDGDDGQVHMQLIVTDENIISNVQPLKEQELRQHDTSLLPRLYLQPSQHPPQVLQVPTVTPSSTSSSVAATTPSNFPPASSIYIQQQQQQQSPPECAPPSLSSTKNQLSFVSQARLKKREIESSYMSGGRRSFNREQAQVQHLYSIPKKNKSRRHDYDADNDDDDDEAVTRGVLTTSRSTDSTKSSSTHLFRRQLHAPDGQLMAPESSEETLKIDNHSVSSSPRKIMRLEGAPSTKRVSPSRAYGYKNNNSMNANMSVISSQLSLDDMSRVSQMQDEIITARIVAEREYQRDLRRWRRRVDRAESKLTRLRSMIFLAASCIVVAAILFSGKTIGSLWPSIQTEAESLENVINLSNKGIELVNEFVFRQLQTQATTDVVIIQANTFCPNAQPELCVQIEGDTFCDFSNVPAAIADEAASFLQFFDGTIDVIFNTLENFQNDLDHVKVNAMYLRGRLQLVTFLFWLSVSIVNTTALICLPLLWYVMTSGRKNYPKRFVTMRSWVLSPLFFILLILGCASCMAYLFVTIVASDFCVDSPDSRALAMLYKQEDQFQSAVFDFAAYYLSGCPIGEVPDEIDDRIWRLESTLSIISDWATSLATVNPVVMAEECGGPSTSSLALGAKSLENQFCQLIGSLVNVRNFFHCKEWYPQYQLSFHEAICYQGMDGFVWALCTQFIIVVMTFVIITLRVGCYDAQVEPKPEIIMEDLDPHSKVTAPRRQKSLRKAGQKLICIGKSQSPNKAYGEMVESFEGSVSPRKDLNQSSSWGHGSL